MAYTSLLNIGNSGTNNDTLLYNKLAPIWVYTSSTTFTVPFTGKYRVICIGKGGDGGNGDSLIRTSSSTTYYIMAGSGGGSGGCGIGLFELTENQSINIVVDNSSSNFDNGKIIATAGGNSLDDYIGTSSSSGTNSGGSGGTVSGTDVLISIPGISGSSTSRTSSSSKLTIQNGGSGANLSCVFFNPIVYNNKFGMMINEPINGTVSYAATIGTSLSFDEIDSKYKCNLPYGGLVGCGGDGAGAAYNYNNNSGTANMGDGVGAKGGPGCILIEYIGE